MEAEKKRTAARKNPMSIRRCQTFFLPSRSDHPDLPLCLRRAVGRALGSGLMTSVGKIGGLSPQSRYSLSSHWELYVVDSEAFNRPQSGIEPDILSQPAAAKLKSELVIKAGVVIERVRTEISLEIDAYCKQKKIESAFPLAVTPFTTEEIIDANKEIVAGPSQSANPDYTRHLLVPLQVKIEGLVWFGSTIEIRFGVKDNLLYPICLNFRVPMIACLIDHQEIESGAQGHHGGGTTAPLGYVSPSIGGNVLSPLYLKFDGNHVDSSPPTDKYPSLKISETRSDNGVALTASITGGKSSTDDWDILWVPQKSWKSGSKKEPEAISGRRYSVPSNVFELRIFALHRKSPLRLSQSIQLFAYSSTVSDGYMHSGTHMAPKPLRPDQL